MKRGLIALALVGLLITPAMADLAPRDRSNTPIYTTAEFAEIGSAGTRAGAAIYDSIGPGVGGYLAAPPALGALGTDDYITDSSTGPMTAFKFVGGMTATASPVTSFGGGGGLAVMWFEWYQHNTTSGYDFVTSAGVLINSAGNFLWTITLGTPFPIPHGGTGSDQALFRVLANTTFTGGGAYSTTIAGQWFIGTADAVVVGGNTSAIGPIVNVGTTTTPVMVQGVNSFSFHVPEPTTLALLAMGGCVLIRRRR